MFSRFLFGACIIHLGQSVLPAKNFRTVSIGIGDIKNPKFEQQRDLDFPVWWSTWSEKIINCISDKDVGSCFKTALNKSLRRLDMIRNIQSLANVTVNDEVDWFDADELMNSLANSLQNKIDSEIKKLPVRNLVRNNFTVSVGSMEKNNLYFGLIVKTNDDGKIAERKMKFGMGNIMYYLMIPALALAGILPWILPQLKMIAMVIMLMNQAAFSMGLTTLIRGLIFDPQPQEHVIYVNNGYKNPVSDNSHKKTYKYKIKQSST